MNKKTPTDNTAWLYFSLIVEIGMNMVLSILLFLALGLWLEKKLKLGGVAIIIGIIIGVLGGFYNSYKAILALDKKAQKK